jgi:hypothetical protein
VTTAHDVIDALRRGPFRAPAFVLLENVRNGTGFQRQDRYADCIALSLWPSRGVYLSGVEVKVGRGDWKKELDHPEKAGEHLRFCRYWWVAAPPGVVELAEVPETWGYMEIKGKAVRTVKAAPKLDEQPPTVAMMAAIIRNAGESLDERISRERAEATAEAYKEIGDEKVRELERELGVAKIQLREARERMEAVVKFEEASGVHIERWAARSTAEQFKAANALARAIGNGTLDHLGPIEDQLRRAAESVAVVRAAFLPLRSETA